jgi:putative transposase
MAISDARRLRTLEDENRCLKQLLADAMPDNAALKDVLAKNLMSTTQGSPTQLFTYRILDQE